MAVETSDKSSGNYSSVWLRRSVVNEWAGSVPHYRKVDTCVEYGVGMHVLAWVSGPMCV